MSKPTFSLTPPSPKHATPPNGSNGEAAGHDPNALTALLALLGASQDGVFAVDAQQRIVYWNGTAERLLGPTASEVMGRLCYEVMVGEDYEGHAFCRRNCPTICAARRGRGVAAYDIRSQTRDGRDIWLNMTIIPIPRWLSGEPVAVHLFRDVTERRRNELLAQEILAAVRPLLTSGRDDREKAVRPFPTPSPLLTAREQEVLHLLARGTGTAQIAETFGISTGTVRNHVDRIMRKLGAHTRLEAVVRASEFGLL